MSSDETEKRKRMQALLRHAGVEVPLELLRPEVRECWRKLKSDQSGRVDAEGGVTDASEQFELALMLAER